MSNLLWWGLYNADPLYQVSCSVEFPAHVQKQFLFCFCFVHSWMLSMLVCFATVWHYNDVIMGAIASQITSLTIVYSIVYSDADQGKHQSSASLAFVRGIHRGPVNFPHKWPLTRKMFPSDDVIMVVLSLDAVWPLANPILIILEFCHNGDICQF